MEKTNTLVLLDRKICDYHQKNNFAKKDTINCYDPDKRQITKFYKSMADHFYQTKIRDIQASQKLPQALKLKARSQTSQTLIRNPMYAALPKPIQQNNLIGNKVSGKSMSTIPMFSQVESSKKECYFIAKQVRQLLSEDIRQMQRQKEIMVYRKHFPEEEFKNQFQQNEIVSEEMILEFNRLLTKQKNAKSNNCAPLSLLEKQNTITIGNSQNDQKFKILNLFRKLHNETKNEDITPSLLDYLKRFELNDKFSKKMNNDQSKQLKQKFENIKDGRKQDSRLKITSIKTLSIMNQSKNNIKKKPSLSQFSKKIPIKQSRFNNKKISLKIRKRMSTASLEKVNNKKACIDINKN